MSFNLLRNRAFPVLHHSGARAWLSFKDACAEDGDFPVAFDWPRPDLNVATLEFFTGVLSLIFQPERHADWLTLWRDGASKERLANGLEILSPHFNVDGDGPRFMQDLAPLEGDANAIEGLFIDTPGVNGQKKNTDLLTHRGRYEALGLPAAAMALYALQQYAPSGGAGNRTSMRGGGPLTAWIALTDKDDSPLPLWRALLANLPLRSSLQRRELDLADPAVIVRGLPWLAPTLTSEKERIVHESDADASPVQAYFGMPRRIRLSFGETEGICALTGRSGPVATGFVQRPYGANYGLWMHPLTPYRRQKEGSEPYSVKPKSGRIGYRDWVGITVGDRDQKLRIPAQNLKALRNDRASAIDALGAIARLIAAGWAMNNMEAQAYLYSEQPLHVRVERDAGDGDEDAAEQRDIIADQARSFAEAGDQAARLLRMALNDALFDGQAKATDTAVFAEAADSFFSATEGPFHEALDAMLTEQPAASDAAARRWLAVLRNEALRIFDRFAPPPGDLRIKDGRERVTSAYKSLRWSLSGYGKGGGALFISLSLDPPAAKAPKKGKPK